MSTEIVSFGGWEKCLRLANPHAELIVTLEVGPRIISYHVHGGQNVLKTNADELGKSGEDQWVIRGGHRLWLAPETPWSYAPDNTAVAYETMETPGTPGADTVRLTNPGVAPWQIAKELTVQLAPDSSQVTLTHRATNQSDQPVTVATWGLTVMQPGGLEIIPQPPHGEHPGDLLPNRLIVAWPYTDLSDERWRWGKEFITLRQTVHTPPTKIGLAHREKWVGYLMRNALFIKTVAYEEGATYPDFGCNFETFTDTAMLEVESLSPLRLLQPGEAVCHVEQWHLFGSISDPGSLKEPALAEWLAPFLVKAGIS